MGLDKVSGSVFSCCPYFSLVCLTKIRTFVRPSQRAGPLPQPLWPLIQLRSRCRFLFGRAQGFKRELFLGHQAQCCLSALSARCHKKLGDSFEQSCQNQQNFMYAEWGPSRGQSLSQELKFWYAGWGPVRSQELIFRYAGIKQDLKGTIKHWHRLLCNILIWRNPEVYSIFHLKLVSF